DRRTRQILAEVVRPNGFSSLQPIEANRKLNLTRLKLAAAHYEALLGEEPGDLGLQTALADVYGSASLLNYERWQLANPVTFGEKVQVLWEPTRIEVRSLFWGNFDRTIGYYFNNKSPSLEPEQAAEAVELNEKALRLWRQVVETLPGDLKHR